jgi:hypothetical protein
VPQAVQAGALAPNQQIEDLRREMARLIGGREATAEMQALLSQQQQQQPVPYVAPAAAPPPPPMSEQERQWIEEGRFRMMAERLGYVPRDSVGVGAPPPQLQAQPPAQAVAAGVTDPLAGLNSLIKGLEGLELLKPRLAKLVGVAMPSSSEEGDEEETVAAASKPDESNPLGLQEVPVTRFLGAPVMFPTKAEGIVETVQSFLMANPAIAMEAMTRLGTILNSGAFAKLLERLTGAGGAPAQAAQQAVAQGLVGTGAHALTNGAAAAALAPLGAPVTPAPPPPFRGPRA